MADTALTSLCSFLSSVFALPSNKSPVLNRVLSSKFSLAIVGPNYTVQEALAASLYQSVAAAHQLQETELVRPFSGLSLIEGKLLEVDLASPVLYEAYREEIEKVRKELDGEGDTLIKNAGKKYHVRIRVYSFGDTATQAIYPSDLSRYLTCYICVRGTKGAMLIPRKQRTALKLRSPSAGKLKTAAFVTELLRDAPVVDTLMQAEMTACGQLLAIAQKLNAPLLSFSVEVLNWLVSSSSTAVEHSQMKERTVEKLRTVVNELEGAELGQEGETAVRALKAIIASEAPKCLNCKETSNIFSLRCGHQYCSRCFESSFPSDLLTVTGTLLVPLVCPHCKSGISISDFRNIATDLFSKKLTAAEKRSGLRHCANCDSLHSLAAFPDLECRHCAYCLTQASGECKTCGSESVRGLELTCYRCKKQFPYRHAAKFTCILTGGDVDCAGHPELCNNCLVLALGLGQCCDKHILTMEEKQSIDAEVKMVTMDCHAKVGPREELMEQGNCGHFVCLKCVLDKYKYHEGTLCCPVCSTSYPDAISARLSVCCLCTQIHSDLSLSCGHHLHTHCVPGLISTFSGENCARCCVCKGYISPSALLGRIQPSSSSFFAFNDAFGYSFTFTCPKPGGQSHKINDLTLSPYFFECACHQSLACPHCGAEASEEEHQCRYITARAQVDHMMAQGQSVSQCPNCQSPIELTQDEYHACEGCGCYFAPCCSAFYEAIYYHGAGWHRPDCRKYDREGGPMEVGECSMCARNQIICAPPRKLMRPRLIGPGEVGI